MSLLTYTVQCRAELGKVIWPTRPQIITHTLLVIGISVALAAFLGAVDYLATLGFELLLRFRP